MKKVISLGEIMLRLSPANDLRFLQTECLDAVFGGSEANVAVALSQLGQPAAFVTKLPDNVVGEMALQVLRRYGVDTSAVIRGGKRLGIYFLEKGFSSCSSICTYDRAHSAIAEAKPEEFDWKRIFEEAGWFHFSGITPALSDEAAEICLQACQTARELGIGVSCDVNYRSKLWSMDKARFVLYVGDLVRYRNPSHFQWMAEEIDEKLGKTPLYAVPGNHEILSVNGVVDRSLYNEVFGPGYYWFSYGEVLFVGLDSSTSAYDDEQLQWLDKTLAKIRPQFKYCVIFSHVPPVNVKVPNDHRLFDESHDRFAEVIRNRGVNLLISGHVHYYSESEFAGVPLITLPSSGQPIRSEIKKFGYVMFKADRDGIAKIKPVYVEAGDDMEHWEAFMSSALVDEDINFFSVWVFCAGVVLLFGGKILRL